MARNLMDIGLFQKSQSLLECLVRLNQESSQNDHPRFQLKILNLLAACERELCNPEIAMSNLHSALDICKKLKCNQGDTLLTMGAVYMDLGNYERGKMVCQDAIRAFQEAGESKDVSIKPQATAYYNIAQCEKKLDHKGAAVKNFSQALNMLKKACVQSNDPYYVMINRCYLASIKEARQPDAIPSFKDKNETAKFESKTQSKYPKSQIRMDYVSDDKKTQPLHQTVTVIDARTVSKEHLPDKSEMKRIGENFDWRNSKRENIKRPSYRLNKSQNIKHYTSNSISEREKKLNSKANDISDVEQSLEPEIVSEIGSEESSEKLKNLPGENATQKSTAKRGAKGEPAMNVPANQESKFERKSVEDAACRTIQRKWSKYKSSDNRKKRQFRLINKSSRWICNLYRKIPVDGSQISVPTKLMVYMNRKEYVIDAYPISVNNNMSKIIKKRYQAYISKDYNIMGSDLDKLAYHETTGKLYFKSEESPVTQKVNSPQQLVLPETSKAALPSETKPPKDAQQAESIKKMINDMKVMLAEKDIQKLERRKEREKQIKQMLEDEEKRRRERFEQEEQERKKRWEIEDQERALKLKIEEDERQAKLKKELEEKEEKLNKERQEVEEARLQAELEKKKQEEEQLKKTKEKEHEEKILQERKEQELLLEQQKQRELEEVKKKEDEDNKKKLEEEVKRKLEEEAKRQLDEENKKKLEEEKMRQEEDEKRKREQTKIPEAENGGGESRLVFISKRHKSEERMNKAVMIQKQLEVRAKETIERKVEPGEVGAARMIMKYSPGVFNHNSVRKEHRISEVTPEQSSLENIEKSVFTQDQLVSPSPVKAADEIPATKFAKSVFLEKFLAHSFRRRRQQRSKNLAEFPLRTAKGNYYVICSSNGNTVKISATALTAKGPVITKKLDPLDSNKIYYESPEALKRMIGVEDDKIVIHWNHSSKPSPEKSAPVTEDPPTLSIRKQKSSLKSTKKPNDSPKEKRKINIVTPYDLAQAVPMYASITATDTTNKPQLEIEIPASPRPEQAQILTEPVKPNAISSMPNYNQTQPAPVKPSMLSNPQVIGAADSNIMLDFGGVIPFVTKSNIESLGAQYPISIAVPEEPVKLKTMNELNKSIEEEIEKAELEEVKKTGVFLEDLKIKNIEEAEEIKMSSDNIKGTFSKTNLGKESFSRPGTVSNFSPAKPRGSSPAVIAKERSKKTEVQLERNYPEIPDIHSFTFYPKTLSKFSAISKPSREPASFEKYFLKIKEYRCNTFIIEFYNGTMSFVDSILVSGTYLGISKDEYLTKQEKAERISLRLSSSLQVRSAGDRPRFNPDLLQNNEHITFERILTSSKYF